MNDSTTGGVIVPGGAPSPLEDADLDAFLQTYVTQLVGIDGTLVFPRWQPTVPKQPPLTASWAAIGVMTATTLGTPSVDTDGNGTTTYLRQEELEVLVSFYGPVSGSLASIMRDGIAISQNGEYLEPQAMALIECGAIRSAPELVNQQWLRRHDMTVRFRRTVQRVYPITYLTGANVQVIDDSGHINFTVSTRLLELCGNALGRATATLANFFHQLTGHAFAKATAYTPVGGVYDSSGNPVLDSNGSQVISQ